MINNSRNRSARRVALLASAAALGGTILFSGANFGLHQNSSSAWPDTAHAQTVQRPVGFADIVEKVKPAVISVRSQARCRCKDDGVRGQFAACSKLTDGAVLSTLRTAGRDAPG